MPELKIYIDHATLAREMTFIVNTCKPERRKHEIDALIDFVRALDDEIADMEFTERLHKLTTDLMREGGATSGLEV